MKLSEAIRLGSMLGPQRHGEFSRERRKYIFFGPVVKEMCALGAAYEAYGGGSHIERVMADHQTFRGLVKAGGTIDVLDTPEEWLPVFYAVTECPQCGDPKQIKHLVPHLNDDHRWTREEIARFVSKVEDKVSPPIAAAQAHEPTTRADVFVLAQKDPR